MVKILYLIAPKMFRDEEFFVPFEKFKSAGHDVTVISTQKGTASGKMGGSFKVHKTLDEVASEFYDALVIAGGPGAKDYFWPNHQVHQLIQNFSNAGKVVAAICSAAALPALAGIAQRKKMTAFPGEQEIKHIEHAGAIYTKARVEVDGKLITADGPESAGDFASKILSQLR